MYGTRKKLLNTEIEPHIEALNKINVVGGTRTPTDLSTRPSSVRVYHSATTTRFSRNFRVVVTDVLARLEPSPQKILNLFRRQSVTTTYTFYYIKLSFFRLISSTKSSPENLARKSVSQPTFSILA